MSSVIDKTNNPKRNKSANARTIGPVSDLEKHLPAEWWRTLFNSIYLKTDGDVVENESNTVNDIDLLEKLADIKKEDHILDLCCGQGRHSLELAKRGYQNVSGIDRSGYLIRLARKRAKQFGYTVNFSEGDARRFKVKENSQDVVVVMGNSFGYFEKLEDDKTVLRAINSVLKSQGTLVLDIVNGQWMKENFEHRSWEWIDQNHFVCRERSLATDGCRIISREVVVNSEIGVIADQFYAERLYSFEEIKELLEEVGFTKVELQTNISSLSSRNQDLGMMANRLFIRATAPEKIAKPVQKIKIIDVAVLMGDPKKPDSIKKNGVFNEEDLATINRLKEALDKIPDMKFSYFDNHSTMINRLQSIKPDLVFNLCDEGFNNIATKELHVPALLELLGLPYTGAGPSSLGVCYNKSMVNAIAASIDIPVPHETYYDPTDQSATLPSIFPALLKPNCGDSSIGITKDAVVFDAQGLVNQIDWLKSNLPGIPILVQEFLQGKEYSVGIIGNPGKFEVLPVLEVDYSGLSADLPKILSYESKWIPDSPYWTQIKYKEADIDDENYRNLVYFSKRLFAKLECRDYARFDFRADSEGVLKLLEVNPNPGWCWDGKLNFMAEFAGIKYHELLARIINSALERMS